MVIFIVINFLILIQMNVGAPEFYTGGGKLVTLNGINGKITPEELDQSITG